jgi:hypothetical protein
MNKRMVMKKYIDYASILFISLQIFYAISGFVDLKRGGGYLRSGRIFGFAPWQIELSILSVFPVAFGIVWLIFRYGRTFSKYPGVKKYVVRFLWVILAVTVLTRIFLIFRRG